MQGITVARLRLVGYVLSVVVVLGMAASGCNGRPAIAATGQMGAVHAYVDQLESMGSVLIAVVDEASARAAAPRIREIARDIAVIRARIGQLGKLNRDDVTGRFGERIAAASETLRRETQRIAEEPGLVREVQEALAAVPPLS